MKNIFYFFLNILGLITGIILILIAVWFAIKIYVVINVNNGITYDGFGYPYVYQKPYNPYVVWIYIFGGVGLIMEGFFQEKLKDIHKNSQNQKDT